ncbi:ATP-dependent RNA helicase HrpA [Massilia dura]|uniref:ATP-dependent RNA helicase HrpA n=1 Tax=Pseudoduganella dura TaxID=321982 RepID=A0A6I3XJZ8_9BURK|nr:ATP-dependent RNA helicase HrpA [Pseudoduganella dura]MUI14783.1 ATP-dependent RNA helicase HrpA [Pseudoduganella dura]GGX98061.1 ATP-dependent helicase [Pseudoduganella dura]
MSEAIKQPSRTIPATSNEARKEQAGTNEARANPPRTNDAGASKPRTNETRAGQPRTNEKQANQPRVREPRRENAAGSGDRPAGERRGGGTREKPTPEQIAARDAERLFRNPLPPITFPEDLPVSGRRGEIAEALKKHQVVIVSGETGSGKTTQLPKICLELGRGQKGLIGHTQPRRIAASSTAKRIAQELNSPLGEHVGYKVRFNDTLHRGAYVKLMTDGILLAETQTDPLLKGYDTIIIDEAHERSLNIDFLLGYLKQLLPRRPDLKVIITSATIDAARFARHFTQEGKPPVPVIEVSGRLYAVEVRYRPVEREPVALPEGVNAAKPQLRTAAAARDKRDLMDAIVDGVDEVCRLGPGDVLVFLPGEREIRDAAEALRKHHPPHVEILPLFARLSVEEQDRVFRTTNQRRIVLATNVAETSLTVPGIRYVVDAGTARVKRYSYRNKVEQLQVEPVAQSAANQRAGRCGRVADGVCIRLYDEDDYNKRPKFTDPEILRSSLASVILRMKSLHLADVETFPFIEPPLARAIADGYQLLQELGAVDDDNRLTNLGRKLAKLPLDPRVGRMILAAQEFTCLTEVLIVASALSVQDPRDRPIEHQQAADQAHQKFADEKSEFLSYIKIWRWFEDAIEHKKTNRQLQDNCRANFLSQVRLREWRDVHSQLLTLVKEQGWRMNETPATYEQFHMALLTGLLGNVGFKMEDDPGYLGARGIKFNIWPGSSLGKKAGKWVMAAELVETTRLYARTIARIEPEWIEKIGAHLLRKSWGEPRWEKRPAQVTASEKATLYGLTIYSQRRINYALHNPAEAREIFIRDALVAGDYDTRAPFFAHNHRLVKEIENLEHKSRRQDVLVDEQLIEAFYDKLIPHDVVNGAGFESWHKGATQLDPKLLYLVKEDLMRHEAAGVTTELFPKKLLAAGVEMALTYHFEPGTVRDGVTLHVPLFALNQLSRERCEWLVPGMLKEKVHLLLKSLPQKLRRHMVPLPEYAQKFCERVADKFGRGDLVDAIIADIREQITITVLTGDFKPEQLPAHHFMNFKVIDEHGRQLDMGRNLATLQAEYGAQARQSFQKMAENSPPASSASLAQLGDARSRNGGHGGIAGEVKAGGMPGAAPAPVQPASSSQSAPASAHTNITAWTFGELPELLEIVQGKLTLIGFPALVDKVSHCDLEVFDDPNVAARTHRIGLRRLFALQMKDQIKFVEKSIPNLQQMGMQFMSMGTQEELRDQIIAKAIDIACLQDPLPTDAASFNKRKDEGKSRLVLLVNEIARLVSQVLTEFHGLPKRLQGINPQAAADMQEQLKGLVHKRFLLDTEFAQLAHFPRYLKAMNVRLEKLRAEPARDAKSMAEWHQAAQPYLRVARDKSAGKNTDPKLVEFRWMLEELRVSLFAQELRTPMPVSVKRLFKVWESMQR